MTDFQQECPDAALVLCGNKLDLASQRKVAQAEAADFSQGMRVADYVEASAKTNEGVEELFQRVATLVQKAGHRVRAA